MLLQNLQFTLFGASSNVHHLLMMKHDGSYYLAFWLEEQDYDVNKHVETPVSAGKLTFVSSRVFKSVHFLTFNGDGSIASVDLPPNTRIPLIATDRVAILKLQRTELRRRDSLVEPFPQGFLRLSDCLWE